jgi:hypothetical protein
MKETREALELFVTISSVESSSPSGFGFMEVRIVNHIPVSLPAQRLCLPRTLQIPEAEAERLARMFWS